MEQLKYRMLVSPPGTLHLILILAGCFYIVAGAVGFKWLCAREPGKKLSLQAMIFRRFGVTGMRVWYILLGILLIFGTGFFWYKGAL